MKNELHNRPLVIDLDNTLVSIDTLFEATVSFIKKRILNFFLIIKWILKGKLYFKNKLIKFEKIEPEKIPYNSKVISLLKESKSSGKEIILCSGAHEVQVKLIADYLDIFDNYYGSDKNINLTGKNKAEFLENKYGKGNFDYVGDSHKDLPVWISCNTAYSVNLKKKTKAILINSINQKQKYIEILGRKSLLDQLKIFLRTIRAHQWIKNILLFIPLFLSQIYSLNSIISVIIAFVSFSFLASSIYVINDLFDLDNDRSHPTKKNRPITSGQISIPSSLLICVLLFITSIFLTLTLLDTILLLSLFLYFFSNLLYTFYFKYIFVLDVIILSFFYVLRIIVGGLASNIEVSNWLILFSFFFFLFLALIKRLTEIVLEKNKYFSENKRAYSLVNSQSIKIGIVVVAFISLILFSGYLQTEKVTQLYHNPKLLFLALPIMFYWMLRIFLITLRGKMLDDPILFVLKDFQSWICGIVTIFIIIYQMQVW